MAAIKALAYFKRFSRQPIISLSFFCPKCKVENQMLTSSSFMPTAAKCQVCSTEYSIEVVARLMRDDEAPVDAERQG